MSTLQEFMPEVFTRSEILIWNFDEIITADKNKDIRSYMQKIEADGGDPRQATQRQAFNDSVLSASNSRYLVGRYLEDRRHILRGSHIAKEGRTFHLALDIFSLHQEPVFAPCEGTIVVSNKESGEHNYGNYLILEPADKSLPYIFFGHLANNEHAVGSVGAGEQIGKLGSYVDNENGGWSIHLHLQLLRQLPAAGEAPIGYTSQADMTKNKQQFPDPLSLFPQWKIKR